jgi:hypothetical protein
MLAVLGASAPLCVTYVTLRQERSCVNLVISARLRRIGPLDTVAMLLGTTCPRVALVEHLAGERRCGCPPLSDMASDKISEIRHLP